MLRFVLLAGCLASLASAASQPTYSNEHRGPPSHHRTMQPRQGFGVSGGFGTNDNAFGVNGGFQVGNPGINTNLFFPVVVGLGLLSLFNIVLTVVTPLLNKAKKPAAAEDAPAEATTAAPAAARGFIDEQDMLYMAQNVMEAVQKFKNQHDM